jgi:hypothetical protein
MEGPGQQQYTKLDTVDSKKEVGQTGRQGKVSTQGA